jgi:hypothetical protein
MAAADGPDARVAAFVSTQLRLIAGGSHRMAQLLGDAPLGPAVRARINALAYRPAALLEPELARLGDPDAALAAQLVQGVVNAGVRLLHGQGGLAEVEPLTVTLAQALVRSRAFNST